ncbi:MAG TPA: hypothetical protein VMV92_35755 [Streptosporangiaceae bacterium]|nr:hypothetical protein [Streptosporangiaceae bacterium]
MATGYVSGETMLRPVRLGLVIAPGSAAGLRRAVELAVGSWGGQGFPIIEAAADHEAALRLAVSMGVDCLYPVGDDAATKALARAPGFEWGASWRSCSPFSRDEEGRAENLLPASALYDWYRHSRQPPPPAYHFSWPQDHQLADLLTVWFGRFGADDAGRTDQAALEDIAQEFPLGPGLSLPLRPVSIASQLSISMLDVFQQPRWLGRGQPRWQSRGVIVIDNGNVSHLVSFWNLRASGQEVFPWVESHADLMEEPFTQWLEEVASVTPEVPGQLPGLSVWLPAGAEIPPRLSALTSNGRFRLLPEPHDLDLSMCGQLTTNHVRRFRTDTGQAGEAVIALPVLDFLPRRASWTDLGMVAADIDIWSESPDPAGAAAMVIPALRRLAPHLRNLLVPFTRPRGQGIVIPVRVSQEAVTLMPVQADRLARTLASDAGHELTLTENGRRVHHRIRLLGGVTEDSLANQPAVLAVIRKALKSPYGANTESLRSKARENDGGWPAMSLVRHGFRDYPAQVVGTLAQRGILQPLACLECPNCASTIRVTRSALGEPVRCELCSALVSFGTYIANNPLRPAAWDMKVMPALGEAHFNETVPVMAALSVFQAAFSKGMSGSGMLYLVGAELTNSALKCEIDFMIMIQDAELPAVVIGEAKAGNPDAPAQSALLSNDDLAHLETIQDSFRAIGIDCWICFATTRPSLQPSEADLLRRSCERSLTPVFDFQGSLLPVLPIILTGEDLSVPTLDERHPARRVHAHFPRLPALGKDTCQQHLGLTDVGFATDNAGNWQARPLW